MKEILESIKKECLDSGIELKIVLDKIQKSVPVLEKEIISTKLQKQFLDEVKEYKFHFIDKNQVENIWSTNVLRQTYIDNQFFVQLKPFLREEEEHVPFEQLVPISFKDLKRITEFMLFTDEGITYHDEYSDFVNQFLV